MLDGVFLAQRRLEVKSAVVAEAALWLLKNRSWGLVVVQNSLHTVAHDLERRQDSLSVWAVVRLRGLGAMC